MSKIQNPTLPLRKNEKIIFWVRKHWSANVKILFKNVLIQTIGVSFLVIYILKLLFFDTIFFETGLLILLLYLLGMWCWIFVQWIDEDFDCLIITNERIIDTDQKGLFSISISSTSLDEIQDVRGTINGFWNNIFQTGEVEIQTAARDIVFRMNCIFHPQKVASDILEQKKNFLEKNNTG
jgi:hypothetical protein